MGGRGRGRGRISANNSENRGLSSFEAQTLDDPDGLHVDGSLNDSFNEDGDSSVLAPIDPNTSCDDIAMGTGSDSASLLTDTTMDTSYQLSIEEKVAILPDVVITDEHPLMGLWEGTFDVKPNLGPVKEEGVEEVFFLHALQGQDVPLELSDLPPEPNFSYTAMRRTDIVTLLQQGIPDVERDLELAAMAETNDHAAAPSLGAEQSTAVSESLSAIHVGDEASASGADAHGQTIGSENKKVKEQLSQMHQHQHRHEGESESEGGMGGEPQVDKSTLIPNLDLGLGLDRGFDEAETTEIEAEAHEVSIRPASISEEGGGGDGAGEDGDMDAELLQGSTNVKTTVLVGFGRNKFGRFSMTLALHEPTGFIFCEKKYLLSKFGNLKRAKKADGDLGDEVDGVAPDGSSPSKGPKELMETRVRPRSSSCSLHSTGPAFIADDVQAVQGTAVVAKKRRVGSGLWGKARRLGLGLEDADGEKSGYSSAGSAQGAGNGVDAGAASLLPHAAGGFGLLSGVDALDGSLEAPDDSDSDSDYKSAFVDEDTGEVYEGGWFGGRRHGNGICFFPLEGTMYEGQWVHGREHGRGVLMTGDRRMIYSGEWLDGCMHGQGSYMFPTGDTYWGDMREGVRHGRGEYTWSNGCSYVGEFRDNKRHGKGLFTWPDGSKFDGEWEGDCRHGRGLLTLSSGFKYDGYWVNNFMEGRGITTFPDGQVYQGAYKQGQRDGRGSITFAEGAVYEGRFREDRIDGQGTIKVTKTVPGKEDGERMIPIQIQTDIRRIHLKAGFGDDVGH